MLTPNLEKENHFTKSEIETLRNPWWAAATPPKPGAFACLRPSVQVGVQISVQVGVQISVQVGVQISVQVGVQISVQVGVHEMGGSRARARQPILLSQAG